MIVTILGSSGQIGSALTNYLKNKNYEVIEFDIINGLKYDLRVTPNLQLENTIEKSDFVFFLAFDVGGSKYLKKYQHTFDFINNNCKLMTNTFDLLSKYNKKFIFASSQMSNMSYSPYGTLKNIGEFYTKSLNGLIVKFWNVYGIETNKEKSHVITDFIRKGFDSNVIDMLTDGEERRDFLYVDDCCEALEILMLNYHSFKSTDELHVTSFEYTKIIDIANIILKEFEKNKLNISLIKSNNKDSVQLNKENVANKYINNWWVPKTKIEDGISKVFERMKKNYGFK
jgi:nucleoside-diphosphate-sugar epimerase